MTNINYIYTPNAGVATCGQREPGSVGASIFLDYKKSGNMKNEIFKDILGYEGLYQVSNMGRVKGCERVILMKNGTLRYIEEKIITPKKRPRGYAFVALSKNATKKIHSVHQLVAKTFIKNPKKHKDINHINGNKVDNRVVNLEWVSQYENMQHAIKTGLVNNNGSNCKTSKLKEQDVILIREYSEKGKKLKEISDMFGVTIANISYIIKRQSWKHVS